MSESETTQPLITLELDTGERKFTDLEELHKWSQKERQVFKWLFEVSKGEPYIGQLGNAIEQWLDQVDQFRQKYESHRGNEQQQNSLLNNLNQAFKTKNLRTSESSDARFAFTLHDEYSDPIAGYALCHLTHQYFPLNNAAAMQGSSLAVQHQQVDRFDQLEKSIVQRFEDLEQTYNEKLALQSSVRYWTDKRKRHQKIIWWTGVLTFCFGVSTGIAFILVALELLKETLLNVPLSSLGIMFAISTFGIWLTRLSAKIFVSNLHLRTDSDERVTMIQTYLALLREGNGPKDEERQLILQTLFRPSTTGFIKEDGPTSFYEVIPKAIDK